MKKRILYYSLAALMLLVICCATAAAAGEKKVSLQDYLPYENGRTTISWDVNETTNARYVVTYKVIENGTAKQSELTAGKTYTHSVDTTGIIPGKCYEISVKDMEGNVLDQKAYRMDEAEAYEKNNLVKINIRPSQIEKGKDPKKIGVLKAEDMNKGFSDGTIYYGVRYQMSMARMKGEGLFVTLAFESPDGYLYVDKARDIIFDKEMTWEDAGKEFFWQMYRENHNIPGGKYTTYLFWNGKFVNTSSFYVK